MPVINEILDGRYRIKRQLGLGGMGTVYEAEDLKRFGKSVALKEIRIDVTKAPTQKQQELFKQAFEREAKILTQLDYEAFPQVIDYFTEADHQYLVMELVQGDDLEKQLSLRQKPFSVTEVLNLAEQLLDALDYLHTLSPPIIHRDIKPQNLKLTSRGRIKLLDFGIAKDSDAQANFTITNQTFLAATLHYSPIEQILRVLDPSFLKALMPMYGEKITKNINQSADPSGDIYALGATLYHLLTDFLPVDALKRTLEVWAGSPDPLLNPQQINSEIPIEVSQWLLKAMEIERENRFSSAIEMQKALHEILFEKKLREDEAKKEEWIREQEWLRNQERLKEQEWLRKQESLKEKERLEEQEKLKREREEIEVERRNIEEARLENLKQIEAVRQLHLKEVKETRLKSEVENQRLSEVEKGLQEQQKEKEFDNESVVTRKFIELPPTITNPIVEKNDLNTSPTDLINNAPTGDLTEPLYSVEIYGKPNKLDRKIEKVINVPVLQKKTGLILLVFLISLSGAVLGMWQLIGRADNSGRIKTGDTTANLNQTNYLPEKSNNNSLVTKLSSSKEDYFQRGEECRQARNYECAIENYTMTIKLNAGDASAYNNRGIAYFNKTDYFKAIADYTKAIELKPKNIIFYQNRIAAYNKTGDQAQAQNDLQTIERLRGTRKK